MKRALLLPILLVAGAAVGGASGYGVRLFLGAPGAAAKPADEPTQFVTLTRMSAPLVLKDGSLSGYIAFEAQLEVPEAKVAEATAKLPFVQHAINLRTYRTPLAAGPDGMIPDVAGLRAVTAAAADEALGKGVVRRVAITQAVPL